MKEPAAPGNSANASRRVVSPELIGRARELELLLGAVAHPPAVAVVEGEAGIGKSRLVGELAARLQRGGRDVPACRVLIGRCHRVREPFPLGPVLGAVRTLDTELGRLGLSPLAAALRPLLPELAGQLPPALAPLGDAAAERYRVFRALAEVLAAVGPAVLVLEDLHWADEQTREFLAFLVDEQPVTLGLVLTFRGEEVAGELRAVLSRPPASAAVLRLELVPLDETATGALAASILDSDGLSGKFTGYLYERTDGVPFAVEEVLALLRERGVLTRHGDGWERRGLDELGVPGAILQSVRERVARLSAEARALVEAAAVLDVASPDGVVVAVAGLDRSAAVDAIAEAAGAGLLQDGEPGLGFRHALAAQAVYEGLPVLHRRDLHSAAADALRRVEPQPLGRLAHHLRRAERLDDWAVAAEQAAEQAVELGDHAEATRVLEAVLREVTLRPERRGHLAVKLGRAACEALRAREVVGLMRQALDGDLAGPLRGELSFVLALSLNQAGEEPLLQKQLFEQGVDLLDDRPELRAHAMVALAATTAWSSPVESVGWAERAELMLAEGELEESFEIFLRGKIAMIQMVHGQWGWRATFAYVEGVSAGAASGIRAVNACWSVGSEACYLGHFDTAQRLLSRAVEGAVAWENRVLELGARAALAHAHFRLGAWDVAEQIVETFSDDLSEFPKYYAELQVVVGGLAVARGDLKTGVDALRAAASWDERAGVLDAFAVSSAGLARAALRCGDLDEASAVVNRYLGKVVTQSAYPPVAAPIIPVAADVFLRQSDAAAARELVRRYAHDVADLDAPLAPAALAFAEGFVCSADGAWTEAAERFLTAAHSYELLPCPYEAAQATEQAALAMFESGDDRAEATLRAALAAFKDLGASWDVARCTHVGRDHGVSLPVPYRRGRKGYGDALSPREAEVARLAAGGLTNKQIGEELFLSPHTVTSHLVRAMRKLGVSSRRELILAAGPAPGPDPSEAAGN